MRSKEQMTSSNKVRLSSRVHMAAVPDPLPDANRAALQQ